MLSSGPPRRRRVSGPLPGLGPALALAWAGLGLIVVLPLAALAAAAAATPPERAWRILADPRTLAALRVSLGCAAAASLLAVPLGLLLAWVLTRYRMPGMRLLDAAVDLPFALPTAVSGLALTALWSREGWVGVLLAPLGWQVAYTRWGIGLALLFTGLPFVVRTVQPVLAAFDRASEEAALLLAATPWQTFRWVIWPALAPAALSGAALAFARGLGEYGSVIFIAGNRPGVSEILPLLIVIRLEEFDVQGAALLGTAMLVLSFLLLALLMALGARRG